ncbi:MAG: NUDIX hydrolase [Thermoplasmata archaeon]
MNYQESREMKSLVNFRKEDPFPERGEASVTFISDGSRFVLIKRNMRNDDPWSGQMALPGGYRKKGESSSETARREAYEEVGIELKILYYMGLYDSKARNIEVKAFISEVPSSAEPIPGDEVSEAFWVPVQSLVKTSDAYMYGQYRIWGMTYRILADILQH